MMGITCEACHGPGRNHVAAEMAGIEGAASLITNPAHLSPEDGLDFRGSCHRSFGDAITNGWNKIGVPNARFQPYRLEKANAGVTAIRASAANRVTIRMCRWRKTPSPTMEAASRAM